MMRRMLLATLFGMFCVGGNLSAVSMYQSLQNRIVGCGQALDTINLPLFGQLTNLLPFGMVAACLKEHPGQMTIVLAGLLAYVLSQNESVRSLLSEYNVPGFGLENDQLNQPESDDTLFVFDGEDDEDAQEEIDTEDELLQEDLLNEEYYDTFRDKKVDEQPVIKFL